ncbi:FliC/FljB family flagellin [Enterobacteriaceae bacterium BIT-l23]|uniref:Flagellin n=1 Tax=Jejubacter calystegiae TaxID=2579935 RepID=A0A4V1G7A9_9ENTR|nr:FliC/FljB family flagellin [Jejubacter calystegiae]NUU65869.1 FliC/FljB family flagellin [Enterobacteriaceae bacterium BIT-l23]QCT19007.1 FliC/FljB family flagellin [Jejubacter calystegiae]
MAQVINTNTLSLTAQNNMNRSQGALGTAIERLSSGLRINSAKDDAAGQAISNRFTANINGLSQASRNANDGISIAQTTEGALNEINDNLQNIRRLTVQAQNATNSGSDRKSIQDEIDQRLSEINRISEQTEFNGVKVLSKDQTLSIQVGSNDGQTIEINLNKMDATTLGMDGFNVNNVATKLKEGSSITTGSESYKLTATDMTTYNGGVVSMKNDSGDDVVYGIKEAADGAKTYFTLTAKAGTNAGDPSELDSAAMTDTTTIAKIDAASSPLADIDAAIAQVDDLRSGLGAVQNRFDSVINNLDSTVNNLSASRSRILDADYATEVSNMSRAQILQQAGTTVLAQANQVPQNVLSLLR